MKSSSEPQYVKQKKGDFLVVERGSAEIWDSHFEAEKIWDGLFRLIFAVKLQNIQGKPWSFTYADCPGNRNSALWKLLPKVILLEKSLKIFRIKEVTITFWNEYWSCGDIISENYHCSLKTVLREIVCVPGIHSWMYLLYFYSLIYFLRKVSLGVRKNEVKNSFVEMRIRESYREINILGTQKQYKKTKLSEYHKCDVFPQLTHHVMKWNHNESC